MIHDLVHDVVFDAYSLLSNREVHGKSSAKIVFVLFDAGETKALEPVIAELGDSKIDFQILAFGTAWTLMQKHERTIDIHDALGVAIEINQTEWGRFSPLESHILEKIDALLKPDIVITGLVSEMQKQIALTFKAQGADVLGYYDSFSPIQKPDQILPFLALASRVLVPSRNVAESVHQLDSTVKVDIVGQPILEQWIEKSRSIDQNALRNLLQIDSQKPLMVYVSGYGEGYAEAFTAFSRAIQYVDHFHVGISLHPKMNGVIERQILDANDCPHVRIIPPHIDTSSVVALSDLVVTWRSTVGVQAAFLGKPVIYLDERGSTFTSLAIEKGWALQLFDSGEFLKLLIEFETEIICPKGRFAEGGVPREATHLILRRIVKNKERAFLPRKPLNASLIELFQRTLAT